MRHNLSARLALISLLVSITLRGYPAFGISAPGSSPGGGRSALNPPAQAAGATASSTAASTPDGVLSVLSFGIVCSGSLTSTSLVSNVQGYAAMGKTSDAQLQTALAAAGNYAKTFTGMSIEGGLGNLPQGVLEFPAGQLCAISSPLVVPVGTKIRGNNAVLVNTGAGDALQLVDQDIPGQPGNYPNGLYGRTYDSVENLIIEGPGSKISNGDCLLVNTALDVYMANVHLFGCKHGLELQEVEYSYFANVWGAHNGIGLIGGKAIQRSLENTFVGGGFERNDRENIWLPDAIRFRFYGSSASFGGHIPVLIGPQPPPYLSTTGYTVTSPGSGCTATITNAPGAPGTPTSNAGIGTATLAIAPLQFADRGGSGTGAQGFAVIVGGQVTSAYGTKSGANYSTEVAVTLPAAHCAVQPAITATTIDDSAGETQGIGKLAAETGFGGNILDGLDVEAEGFNPDGKTPNKPTFGYLFAFTNGEGGDIVRDVSIGLGGSAPEFLQLLYTSGSQAVIEDAPGSVRNPLTGSTCFINQAHDGGVILRDLGNRIGQACDLNDNPALGGAAPSIGFFNGTVSGSGFTAWATSQYTPVTNSMLFGQAAPAGHSQAFPWFVDYANGSRQYTDGTGQTAPDLITGRSTDPLGAAFTLQIGHTSLVTNVVPGPAFSFITEVYTTGANATYPSVGTSGMPAGMVCTATHRWDGGGALNSLPTMTFNATALCDNADTRQAELYYSAGQTLGKEAWAPANTKANGLTLTGLSGNGNSFACLTAAGALYRSATACR